jgi:hypothetical protein
VARLIRETQLVPAAHLTCVGATCEEVDEIARTYWAVGVRHIVSLRGDAPPGESYHPHPNGYAFAVDLVTGLRRVAPFEISVAAYPEVHPQAQSPMSDLDPHKAMAASRRQRLRRVLLAVQSMMASGSFEQDAMTLATGSAVVVVGARARWRTSLACRRPSRR